MKRFLGLDFKTTKDTFTPRPETELLVRVCLDSISTQKSFHILDLGTGAGNIAISLTKLNRVCKIVALDKSKSALAVAKENARQYGVSRRIRFLQGDLFGNLGEVFYNYFDIVVSNPPYVAEWEVATLADHVREEPKMAIGGGADGLDFYKKIIEGSPRFLKNGGSLMMEIGYGQSFKVKRLLKESFYFRDIEIFKDFAGIDRVTKAKRWIS